MLLLLAFVAGCAIAPGVGPVHKSPTTILVLGAPNAAAIGRYGPTAGHPPLEAEQQVTITDPGTVSKLVADANSLPMVPLGTVSCPADDGSYYQLRFVYGDGDRRTLHVGRQGCQGVGFAETSDRYIAWSLTDPRLLRDLDALFPLSAMTERVEAQQPSVNRPKR
jgi:hypothetical protein